MTLRIRVRVIFAGPARSQSGRPAQVAAGDRVSSLTGLIFDARGNLIVPRETSFHRWGGAPGAEIEARVACAVREHLADCTESDDSDLIRSHLVRVKVQADQLAIELKAEASSDPPNAVHNERLVLRVLCTRPSCHKETISVFRP
jgi:hypothetical protein